MKKILSFLIGITLSVCAFSQAEIRQISDTVRVIKRSSGDAVLDVRGIFQVSNLATGSSTDSLVVYDPITKKFKKITRTSLLMHTHPQYQIIGLSDSLLSRYTKTQVDALLALKLNLSDTSAMLSNRLKVLDTAAMLSNRLKISDTSNAFSKYDRKTDGLQWSRILSTPTTKSGYGITDVVAYADTAAMLSNRLKISDTSNLFTNVVRKSGSVMTGDLSLGSHALTAQDIILIDAILGIGLRFSQTNGTTAQSNLKANGSTNRGTFYLYQVRGNGTGEIAVLHSDTSGVFYFDIGANLPAQTASRALVTDASKNIVSSSVTSTELGLLSGKTTLVSSIGVTTDNGVSGSSSGGSTPSLTLTLGNITPSSINTSGNISVTGYEVVGTYDGGAQMIQLGGNALTVGEGVTGNGKSIYTIGDISTATKIITPLINNSGGVIVQTTSNSPSAIVRSVDNTVNQNNLKVVRADNSVSMSTLNHDGQGWNTGSDAVLFVGKVGTRSINAGGTVNASGADYAEYMRKASYVTHVDSGAILGIDRNGLLTNRFDSAHSFVIKSTDPSYVGGDTWGSEVELGKKPEKDSTISEQAFQTALTAWKVKRDIAKNSVEIVAFSGQVPCNVFGANVGEYIIPIRNNDGTIGGLSTSTPTFDQYRLSIGKVWKIMKDGRAWVAVKI